MQLLIYLQLFNCNKTQTSVHHSFDYNYSEYNYTAVTFLSISALFSLEELSDTSLATTLAPFKL